MILGRLIRNIGYRGAFTYSYEQVSGPAGVETFIPYGS